MGWQLHCRVQLLRELTHRVCLNGAPLARSEFRGAAHTRAPQVARSEAKGRSQQGRLCFGYFHLAPNESDCAAGRTSRPAALRSSKQNQAALQAYAKAGTSGAERSDGLRLRISPSECAEEHRVWAGQLHRRVQLLRELTHRVCLNGEPAARSEFRGAAHTRAPQVARSEAKGRIQQGRLCFGYFHLAPNESDCAAGRTSRPAALRQ